MLIDCSTCVARDVACGDCVVTVLLAGPPPVRRPGHRTDAITGHVADAGDLNEFDEAESAALGTLAAAGLVPPLRLVRPLETGGDPSVAQSA